MMKLSLFLSTLILTGLTLANDRGGHYNFKYVKFFQSQAFAHSEGTGVIKGKVVYVGKRELKNRRKLITKDKEVCGRGYKIDKVYEVSEDGGVKNAVVFINGKGNSRKNKKVLVQEMCEFKPRVLSMEAGSVLEVVNKDSVKHEANGVQDFETIFQLSQHKKGMVDKVSLDKAGVVEVTCNIHGWMKAWVVVVEGTLHSVTDKRGEFLIKGVPAGKHKLKLWHEGFGEKEMVVNLKEGEVKSVVFELK